MKKILLITALLTIGVAAYSQSTNVASTDTFTNGVTINVAVSDQQFNDLRTYRQVIGATNQTAASLARTNPAVMVGILAPAARQVVGNRKRAVIQKILSADDATLQKYEAVN